MAPTLGCLTGFLLAASGLRVIAQDATRPPTSTAPATGIGQTPATTPTLPGTPPVGTVTPLPTPSVMGLIAPQTPNATTSTQTGGLTLDEAIRIALQNHGNIGAAQESVISSVERITAARSALYPQVDANLGYNVSNVRRNQQTITNVTTTGTGGTTTTNGLANSNVIGIGTGAGAGTATGTGTGTGSGTGIGTGTGTGTGIGTGTGGTVIYTANNSFVSNTTTGITVSQNLFDSGRTRTLVREARATALSSIANLGVTRSTLAFAVAQNFYAQLLNDKLVSQRQGEVNLAQQQLAQVQAQVAAGTAAAVDVQSVQVTLSQAQFNLVTAQNAARTSATTFRNSLGLPRGPVLALQDVTIPSALPTASLEQYIAEAHRLRPDLLQVNANVQQTEAVLNLAKIQSRPQLTATAGYSIDPRSVSSRGLNVGAGLSIPIFDAGGRKADVRAASADLAGNRIRLNQTTKDAEADVEATYVNITGARQRIVNAQALQQAAATNLQTATEKYQQGLGIVLDIVNAQTQLFTANTSLTQAIYDYETAQADLDRAVGRFAWANPGQAVPAAAPTSAPSPAAVRRNPTNVLNVTNVATTPARR